MPDRPAGLSSQDDVFAGGEGEGGLAAVLLAREPVGVAAFQGQGDGGGRSLEVAEGDGRGRFLGRYARYGLLRSRALAEGRRGDAEVRQHDDAVARDAALEGQHAVGRFEILDLPAAFTGVKRMVTVLELDQALVEGREFVGAPVRDRILLEEGQAPAQADLLARVDQRLALGQGEAEDGADVGRLALALKLRPVPGSLGRLPRGSGSRPV